MPRVTLLKPHVHAGVPIPAGQQIEVDVGTARWLIANAVATEAGPLVSAPQPKFTPRKDSSK